MNNKRINTCNNLPYSSEYINKCIEDCKSGFTLAEVLTTLTVIGVVAALTIPSLIQSADDRQYKTASKKVKSTLANAYRMMKVNSDNETFNHLPIFECETDFACLSKVHRKLFRITNDQTKSHNGLPESYTTSDDSGIAVFNWDKVPYIFTTNDGMTYGFLADERIKELRFVVDVNGKKGPNKICKDMFKYTVDDMGVASDGTSSTAKATDTYKGACEDLNDFGLGGCSDGNINACTTDEAVSGLWKTMKESRGPNDKWGSAKHKILNDYSCLVMTNANNGDYWFNCSNKGEYCYTVVTPGSAKCKMEENGISDMYSLYCN